MKHHKSIIFKKLFDVLGAEIEPDSKTVVRIYGVDESNFVDSVNNHLQRKGIAVLQNKKGRNRDIVRYGTSMGIIDVASDKSANDFQSKALGDIEESQENDLKRFGTSTGVINVAQFDVNKKRRELANRCLPSNRRYTDSDATDTARFGTSQGIINVSTGDTRKLKIPCYTLDPSAANLYAEIFKDFTKAQVTIRNSTSTDKEVMLWGPKSEFANGEIDFQAVQQQSVTSQIASPVHPQGMAYNPANNVVYAVNQLSGTVTIVNQQNELVSTVQLQPSLPGLCSPVAIAVNTNPTSTHYGFAYVACSVSNSVQVLNPAHELVATLSVGCRPVAVSFNGTNNCVYIANLVDNTVSVINSETHLLDFTQLLNTGDGPIGLGVNPSNGDVYVCNSVSNSVSVYDAAHNLVSNIINVGQRPVSATYNSANGFIYVSATNSNQVLKINTSTHAVDAHINVGTNPYNAFFVPANQFLYVQNRTDNTFTILRSDDTLVGTINVGEQNIGGVFNPTNSCLYITDTPNNKINVVSFGSSVTGISINADYEEMQANFKNCPAVLQHVRFIISGNQRPYNFSLNRSNVTGTANTRRLSIENYASPAHGQNVIEFAALAGTHIDHKMNWKFMLPASHTISVLIWYKQFQVQGLLNEFKNNKKTK